MKVNVKDLNVELGGSPILKGINFEVGSGKVVGLLGPNGSGKSTLIKCLAGLIPTAMPYVAINDKLLCDMTRRSLAQKVAFVPQHAEADGDLSILDIVRLGRTPFRGAFSFWSEEDNSAVSDAMAYMHLNTLKDRAWQHLSGGERQRCQIARALAQKPDVLILDEPTNHLDIEYQLELMRLIMELPITVIVALHDLNLAANYCQLLAILARGQLVASGAPSEVLTADLLRSIWRVNASIDHSVEGCIDIRYSYHASSKKNTEPNLLRKHGKPVISPMEHVEYTDYVS